MKPKPKIQLNRTHRCRQENKMIFYHRDTETQRHREQRESFRTGSDGIIDLFRFHSNKRKAHRWERTHPCVQDCRSEVRQSKSASLRINLQDSRRFFASKKI